MSTVKPNLTPLVPDTIPYRLRERDQWVCWRLGQRADGTWTKQPVNARTGSLASTTDRATWSTFDRALAAATNGKAGNTKVDGIGFVFATDDPFVGIDLDHVNDHPELLRILDGFNTYQERSPSGTGVHLILEGTLPDGVKGRRKGPIEIYQAGRFFTMTGHILDGVPSEPQQCDDPLADLWQSLFPPAADPGPQTTIAGTTSLTDGEIIERASNARNGDKFRDLFFTGSVANYNGDDSAADLALLSILAFWTQDRGQLERIFARSALGQRPKWQREDYRERTIDRALDRTGHYTGDSRSGSLKAALDGPPTDSTVSEPVLITAAALMRKVFPEPRWAVPGVFPEGLSLLVGAPKLGKSWLGLNVGVAVALGGRAIGKIAVDGGDVLYLALEDTERRLQERLATTLQGEDAPTRLHIATTWPMLADGAAVHLGGWLAAHRDARLVIIDTFQKLRGPIPGNQNQYAGDYAAAGELKRVADRFGVALVCIHHTRKASADDPLDMVSGTAGLAGSTDTTCVLRREIGRSDATLYIRGRDVPEADHALSFDAGSCTWTLLGDAHAYRVSEERQEILDLLRGAVEPMSPKHIAEALGKKDGAVRFLLHKMTKSGDVDGIGAYRLPLTPANSANTTNALILNSDIVSAVSGVSGLDAPRCVQCGQPVDAPGQLYCRQHGDRSSQPPDWPHMCLEPGCENRCTFPHKYYCDQHIQRKVA